MLFWRISSRRDCSASMAAGTCGIAFGSVLLAMGRVSFCPARQGCRSVEEGAPPSTRLLMGDVPALGVNRGILLRAVLGVERLDADSTVQMLLVVPHRTDLTLMGSCPLHARGRGSWKVVKKRQVTVLSVSAGGNVGGRGEGTSAKTGQSVGS